MTPGLQMTSAVEDYFGTQAAANEVGAEEETEESYQLEDDGGHVDEDEAEVAKLTGGKSLGLGSWVDGFMNWVLYDDVEEERLRQEKSKMKEKNQSITGGGQIPGETTVNNDREEVEAADAGEGGILKDAGWLLGIASRILF